MTTRNLWSGSIAGVVLTALLLLLSPTALFATDGHFLHGAGPVNGDGRSRYRTLSGCNRLDCLESRLSLEVLGASF